MDRYMIETPHTEQNCRDLLGLLNAAGYLHHFDWGCTVGVHCGWATIEAEDESQARLAVPPLVRNQARVVKLAKFTCSILDPRPHDHSSADRTVCVSSVSSSAI
jgi:hypothetical protein